MARPDGVSTREQLTVDRRVECDVVVIGSGAGGGVVAAELAEAGLEVLVLEEGGYHGTEEFLPEPATMVRKLYRDGGASASIGSPPVIFSEGRTVGGSTVINGGMSWRTPEKILDRWRRDDQVEAIDPAAMERYFARVERFIHAAPQDESSIGRDNQLLREGADRKGWQWIPNIRNQVHCVGSNNCAFGCPTAAKRSTLVTYIPRALGFGAKVQADCRVERLILDGRRIAGVRARAVSPDGSPGARLEVRARHTVVACGAIQTPALLLRSKIASPSGRIGRDLALHPNTKVQAVFDETVDGWKGAHQAYQVREFARDGVLFAAVALPPGPLAMAVPYYGDKLREVMALYPKIVNAGLLLEDSQFGRVRLAPGGSPIAFYDLADVDADRAVRATALLCELLFEAGARWISSPFDGVPDLRSVEDCRKLATWKVPKRAIELFTVHLMGTARMGGDPARHVCDAYGRVYGWDDLWVADASLFPSPIGVNPMETIMALATRAAERLIEDHEARRGVNGDPAALFRGTAWYYRRYRPGYPPSLIDRLVAIAPAGARVVDLGCGTGQLAVPLAGRGCAVAAIDPSPEMLAEAAGEPGAERVRWILGVAERLGELVAEPVRLVGCAAAFHWMDRRAVLAACDARVEPGGAVAIVSGAPSVWTSEEPWARAAREVEKRVLGERRRAGAGLFAEPRERHEQVLAGLAFSRVERWHEPQTIERTLDQVVGLQLSTSHASPALLGDRRGELEGALREALAAACPDGRFVERFELEALIARRP